MLDFALAMPEAVCAELGTRIRTRRLALDLSQQALAARAGVAHKTLCNVEQSGKCTLETFLRLLDVLGALPDMQKVLVSDITSIEEMRMRIAAEPRKRASHKIRKSPK